MINIISRSLIFNSVSGPRTVVMNLIKGLNKINYPYIINGNLNTCSNLYIHDDRIALRKALYFKKKIKIVAGPNLYVLPRDIPSNLNLDGIIYLQPSLWVKNFWEHLGFNRCSIKIWATGIDIDEFSPLKYKNRDVILVYFKQRFLKELHNIEQILRNLNLKYRVIVYGNYKQSDYQEILKETKFIIWIGRQESQGIALQEALAMNIPILVWDVSCVGHCSLGNEFNENEKKYSDTTSAPYFNKDCGLKTKNGKDMLSLIHEMNKTYNSFSPRKFILNNLSLEKQAQELINFYFDKQFNLINEFEMNKTFPKWRNAYWHYQLYLKIKHKIKMFLFKISLWK